MKEWSMRLVAAIAEPLTDAAIESLYSSLSSFDVALGQDEHGNFKAQLSATGATLLRALGDVIGTVMKALAVENLNPELIEVQVMSWEEFDRRLDLPLEPQQTR